MICSRYFLSPYKSGHVGAQPQLALYMTLGRLIALVASIALLGALTMSSPTEALAQQASSCVAGGAVTDGNNPSLISDCDVLLGAGNVLAGTGATRSLNWAADTPIADWYGVVLSGTPRRVTALRLPGQDADSVSGTAEAKLRGSVPASLGRLSMLSDLNLQTNELTGPIPDLSNIVGLEELYLSSNVLMGRVPAWLGGMTQMRELWLSENSLTGQIPEELGDLSGHNLVRWRLGGGNNQFTGCVPVGLADVEDGDLDRLGLTVCGEEPPHAADTAVLAALYNATDGDSWVAKTNWLSGRSLGKWHGIATDDAGRVTEIRLPRNRLFGELPSEISELTELTRLDLRRNELIGEIPDDLDDLINLDSLNLGHNLLSGEIPPELGNLPNLESLSLESNQLDRDIPDELGNLTALESLSLGNNQLDGSIPAEFGNLINLSSLLLAGNELSGGIPDELRNLVNLTHLDLRLNRLRGRIPAGLGSLSELTYLDLGDNRLLEGIPRSLGNLSSLELLSLSGNELNGQIPSRLGNLIELAHLDLSENQLTGQIPAELGNLGSLTGLYLSDNQFAGCIPVVLKDVATNDVDEIRLPDCVLTVAMTLPPGNVQLRIDSPIAVTATFSEPVTGFTAGDVRVANASVSNFAGSGGGAVYTFDITPNAIGVVTMDIDSSVAQGQGGDNNDAAVQLLLGLPYDDDDDGAISRDEVIEAIKDYFAGRITRNQVIDVIKAYFR